MPSKWKLVAEIDGEAAALSSERLLDVLIKSDAFNSAKIEDVIGLGYLFIGILAAGFRAPDPAIHAAVQFIRCSLRDAEDRRLIAEATAKPDAWMADDDGQVH